MYQAVASPFGLLGAKFIAAAPGASGVKRSGITGLVYGGIKGITRLASWLAGGTANAALTRVGPLITERFGAPASSSEREAVLAAINGVLGDQLLATANPLTINMSFRHEGKPLLLEKTALAQRLPQATGKLLVLAHGLCMNDLQWAPAQTAMQMYSPKRSATPRFTCTTTRAAYLYQWPAVCQTVGATLQRVASPGRPPDPAGSQHGRSTGLALSQIGGVRVPGLLFGASRDKC